MSGGNGATMWTPGTEDIVVVNAAGNYLKDTQVATEGQTLVTLTAFKYTLGINSIQVFIDGMEVPVTELTTSSYQLPFDLIAGQTIVTWGLFGAQGSLTQEQVTVTNEHIASVVGDKVKAGDNVAVTYDPVMQTTTISAATGRAFSNRFLNGHFRTDYRNLGAAITPAIGQGFICDRWKYGVTQAAKLSFKAQNPSTITGFDTSLLITTVAAIAPAANDYFLFEQRILASNLQDLEWNKPSAKPLTLRFKVKSSVAGKFSGRISGEAAPQFIYVFAYVIAAANVEQEIEVVIPGAIAFTMAQGKNPLLRVQWMLGYGSSFFTSSLAQWLPAPTSVFGPSDAVQLVSIPAATFEVTGIDLQVGAAGARELMPVEAEEMLCAEYFERMSWPVSVMPMPSILYALSTVLLWGSLEYEKKLRTPVSVAVSGYNAMQVATGVPVSTGTTTASLFGITSCRIDVAVAGAIAAQPYMMYPAFANNAISIDADF